jgi:prepilin-type N-terminal cleavage/methylation domain-containing protein
MEDDRMVRVRETSKPRKRRSSKGFSLLELLIVVAIILIIATIAIPSLMRSRQAAQESSAVATLRSLNTAEVTYMSTNRGRYGEIPDLIFAGLIDERFNDSLSGYAYDITVSDANTNYIIVASAISENTGRFNYYTGPDLVVRYSGGELSGEPVQ